MRNPLQRPPVRRSQHPKITAVVHARHCSRGDGRHPARYRISRVATPVGAIRARGNIADGEAESAAGAGPAFDRNGFDPDAFDLNDAKSGSPASPEAVVKTVAARTSEPFVGPHDPARYSSPLEVEDPVRCASGRVGGHRPGWQRNRRSRRVHQGRSRPVVGDGGASRREAIPLPAGSRRREDRRQPDGADLPIQAGIERILAIPGLEKPLHVGLHGPAVQAHPARRFFVAPGQSIHPRGVMRQ